MRIEMKIVDQIIECREALLSTKPSYWPKFYKHTYVKKKDNIESYLDVPSNVHPKLFDFDINLLKIGTNFCKEQIIFRADKICSGKCMVYECETEQILDMWNMDPQTGYRWPNEIYYKVRKITPQGSVERGNDIKYAWELSNSHFLVTLAQAYVYTEDMKYINQYFMIMDNWIKNNPVGFGVNWSCTMDVALRAINYIVSASILSKVYEPFESLYKKYSGILYSHMLFIRDNLEYGFVRENHYLSDITGLKMLSQIFVGDEKADRIYSFASKSFIEEINYQIYKDGTDHEASTCYHAFVLELFAIGLATDESLRKQMPRKQIAIFFNMVKFSEELCAFNRYPIVGDNDSGRVLDLNATSGFKDVVPVFAKMLFDINIERINEYSFMILGNKRLAIPNSYEQHKGGLFQKGGYAIADSSVHRVLLHSGTIGRKGKGGHGHNDQTSIVVDSYGAPFIIDAGSYVYERDLIERHAFRSTVAHNCVMLGEVEQNNIVWSKPFKMQNNTKAKISAEYKADKTTLVGTHFGYEKKFSTIIHREIEISEKLVITDIIDGKYEGTISMLLTFDPSVSVKIADNIVYASLCNGKEVSINLDEAVVGTIVDVEYSPEYGEKYQTKGLKATWSKNQEKSSKRLIIM